jgi:diaminopimelate decarboxylase
VPDNIGARDYVAILDVGAYCATQHMEFLNIPPAAEVLIDTAGLTHLITAPGGEMDKWRHLLPERKQLNSAPPETAAKIMARDISAAQSGMAQP